MSSKLDLSVVIPVYNEEEDLKIIYDKLAGILPSLKMEYEVIFVNDGSVDKSWNVISEVTKKDRNMKGINLRRNCGQTIAIAAGVDCAKGDIIITMDADLQNDPNDIPKLIKKINEGYDVVSGWRKNRQDPFITKRLPSLIANKIISKLANIPIHDLGCTLKAYRKEVLSDLKLYGEMHRLLAVYAAWMGAKMAEVEVGHSPRIHGQTKYGLSRTFKVILDLITANFLIRYATKPIYVFGFIGIFLFLIGFLVSVFVFIRALLLHGAWVSPMIFIMTICIITGVQFILMGLLSEISIRTYHESQDKAPYVILTKLNID